MNIFDDKVEVDKPQGVSTQSLMLYVPKVTARNAGIATYDNEDFIISKGNVSLYKLQNIAEISYDDKHLARSGAVKQYIDTIKIDLDDVKNELAKKASILYVDTQDDIIKQSITNLDIRLTNEINKKADTTYVDNKLDTKADITYVDSKLDTKADITYVDDKLDTKADITYVDSKFNNMKSYVDSNVLRLNTEELQTMNGSVSLGYSLNNTAQFLGISLYYNENDNYTTFKIGKNGGKADLINDKYLRMRFGDRYNDISFNDSVYMEFDNSYGSFKLPYKDRLKSYILATTDDVPKYSGLVLNQMNGNVNGDSVNLTFDKVNLSTGEGGGADSYIIAPASETTPGLMTSADVKALSDLQQRVGNLEQKATRLIYTAKTDPTAEEINTFVTGLGYTAPFSGIAVVVDKTYHIWHYYENNGWKDDGMDTVNIFTNETAGAIKGAGEIAGKVYAENDGTGSVYGWDALNATVAGKQDKLTAGNNISIENGVIDTKNPVGVELTADATTFTQEQLDILKADDENYIIQKIGQWPRKYYYTGTMGQGESRQYYRLNDSKSGPGIQTISVNGTSGEITRTSSFLKSSNCFVSLNGEVGNLTALQSTLLTNWKQLYQIELADKGLFLNYVKSETVDGKNYNYYSATDCGIEYNIVCDLTSKTWTLTKKYIEIEVPLNADGTISDDALALITKYGEHTYIMNSNIRYNFVKKETGKKNFIQYSNIENDLSRTITVWTDNKTWMELYKNLAERPYMSGMFKLYNDQWVATESSNGAFKQVVTYTHFVNNYHQYTILPVSFSLRMWAECGVGAFEETANDITFYAQTKPTDSLSFNIRHERVEYKEV